MPLAAPLPSAASLTARTSNRGKFGARGRTKSFSGGRNNFSRTERRISGQRWGWINISQMQWSRLFRTNAARRRITPRPRRPRRTLRRRHRKHAPGTRTGPKTTHKTCSGAATEKWANASRRDDAESCLVNSCNVPEVIRRSRANFRSFPHLPRECMARILCWTTPMTHICVTPVPATAARPFRCDPTPFRIQASAGST